MCGIAGLYQLPGASIEAMCSRISHRGPDAHGAYHDGPVALGHQRLAIIDLTSAANQPFTKGEWTIVFNGEIYNYQALAEQLRLAGAELTTHSDTEVILEAWRYWGPECLNKLRGMFAFALYEAQSQSLYLARDPFGIKPLFYYHHNGGLAFASELKALQPALSNSALNPAALVSHLMYLWLPDDQCIYENAEKFPAGHYAVKTPNIPLRIQRYNDLFDPRQPDHSLTMGAASKRLGQVLNDSVQSHMVADVPISVLLSGGLDSSLIAAMAAEHKPDIDAYTIAFRSQDQRFEAMPDDAGYARQIASRLGLKLNEIEISPRIVDLWPKLVASMDEPIGDAASINTYLICDAARQAGVKVLMSGMGADELFAGYRKHYACLLASKFRQWTPRLLHANMQSLARLIPVASSKSGFRRLRWLKRFLMFAGLDEESAFRGSYSYYTPKELHKLLSPDYQHHIEQTLSSHAELYWHYGDLDQINRMCYVDSQWFLRGLNLTYCDRASMAASTEVRVPFVDKHVTETAWQIPGALKIHKGHPKAVLKETARDWLPNHIIDRPKAGFAAPLRSWIRHDLKPMVNDYLLSDQGFGQRGICRPEGIKKLVADDRKGKADNAQRIWQLLTLEIWLRQHEGRL